ncbi:MAG: P-loop NTPase, partial [Eubacteriales bacterium]
IICPDCGKKIEVFGESKIDVVAGELGVPVLARLPIESNTTALMDKGAIELAEIKELAPATEFLKTFIGK